MIDKNQTRNLRVNPATCDTALGTTAHELRYGVAPGYTYHGDMGCDSGTDGSDPVLAALRSEMVAEGGVLCGNAVRWANSLDGFLAYCGGDAEYAKLVLELADGDVQAAYRMAL